MAERKNNEANEIKAVKKQFAVRNIKKEFTTFEDGPVITKQFHIELGDKNETVIVEDRPCDWLELANKDADKVGLVNVLSNIERQGLDVRSFAVFNDSEALDLSELDPMNPHAYNDSIKAQNKAMQELQATASKLGVTVDSLISAAISGKIEDLIKVPEKKEGE